MKILWQNIPRSVCVIRPWDTAVVDILWAKQTEIAADFRPSFAILREIKVLPTLKAVDPPLRKDPDNILGSRQLLLFAVNFVE